MRRLLPALALVVSGAGAGTQPFPLSSVRLLDGPFLEAQATDQRYLMALDADRLLAPFLREAGLPAKSPSYGNWESTGLDGHMGGHYLSALALMVASTGDGEVRARLDQIVAELKRCQDAPRDALMTGYLGGIPEGEALWRALARGELQADNFALNGRWVPWYNLHKTFAGLRDAHLHGGNAEARAMLIRLADWAERVTARLTPAQMQAMLRTEHGGMSEVLVDAYQLSGDPRHLALARRFADESLLAPLAAGEDRLTGLHANTQIPKVIGFERLAGAGRLPEGGRAAQFFWRTVHDRRSVAIGGNSVKEHFHDTADFSPMVTDVEGPETCNTYNMLKLTGLLFRGRPDARYMDFAERAIFNHILSSQHPQTGGLVYFTPMRPNHYRVYSQVEHGMWCCVGSGLESHAKYGELAYAQDSEEQGGALYVNLYLASTLEWRDIRLTQDTAFPDEERTWLRLDRAGGLKRLKLRQPGWVAPGTLRLRINGRPVAAPAAREGYIELRRDWRDGDVVELRLPMRTRLEPLPDQSTHYAVLHGPIVLAAKTDPLPGERLSYFGDGSRMGHIASGPMCSLDSTPLVITDKRAFLAHLKPVPGQPLHFRASGLAQGQRASLSTELMPFFRLHESRYELYFPQASVAELAQQQKRLGAAERARQVLDAITLDQVAPGEQQPESDHGYQAEGGESGLNGDRRWRHASGWFGYELADPKREARVLRLGLAAGDAGRRFDVEVDGQRVAELTLAPNEQPFYTLDVPLPPGLVAAGTGKLRVRFVARPGSVAGGLYALRLLK